MTSMTTTKRRRGSASSPRVATSTAVLLLGAGRLHHALAFGSSTFTTAAAAAAACGVGSGSGRAHRCFPMAAAVPSRGGSTCISSSWSSPATALQAEAGTGTGSWSSSHGHNAGQSQRHKTAMESAILVEWEPISELERRIEDGVHYEHFPDFEHMYGSEEAQRLRKRAVRARSARRAERRRSGGGSGGGWVDAGDQVHSAGNANLGEDEGDDDANLESTQGVFVGFRVTEEEVDRLRSADPADYSG